MLEIFMLMLLKVYSLSFSIALVQLPPFEFAGTRYDELTFFQIGNVIFRNILFQVTRRSLGYAYVNFHNVQDAERALDTMNFSDIKGRPDMKGKPCRIMWSQRDPSLRKSGVGNVFVKNLAPTVDNKGLFDTFSVFGNILSCKVATDENGNSKGYGYVHYETAEAAQDAIQKFNGNFIDDHEVFVGPFVRRQERGQANWTNLYVKQFPLSWDESKLCELFQPYGEIASCVISRDADGSSKGFGFLNFVEHESAEKALEELNGKPLGEDGEGSPTELYVNRAQKKGDRTRDIKNRLDALKEERVSKYQGMNLYVKNLDDSITDDFFRETFSKYGTITSARIMRDGPDGTSKGFGFVCYSSSEEATRAVGELNGKIIRNKPIMVTLHQVGSRVNQSFSHHSYTSYLHM
jgi:polyadenylate-binding protein